MATVEPLGRESDLVDPAEKRFTLDLGPSVCTYPGLAAELLAAERQERYEE